MLKVQEYLRSGKTLQDLENDYGITNRITNNKVALKYSQIASPMGEEICQECRGLILENETWNIIAYPFRKFFNSEEGHSAKLDWKTTRVLEKIDGSNVNLFNYKDEWFFATHNVPEADIPLDIGLTFAELARMALVDMGLSFYSPFTNKLNPNYTYMFELTSPYSQVYIRYEEPSLTLLGVRDNISLKELPINDISAQIGIPTPKEYPLSSLQEIIAMVNSWKGDEQEGVVLIDGNFNRVKVKNINYVTGQAIVFSLSASDRNIMRLIMLGSDDDVFAKCPSLIQEKISLFKGKLADLIKETKSDYAEMKDIEDMKEYAAIALKKRWKAILFGLKRGKVLSIETYLKENAEGNGAVDTILELCGLIKKGECRSSLQEMFELK